MTPELKAKLTAYNKMRRARTREVLARAAEVRLAGGVPAVPVRPQQQATHAKPHAAAKRRR